MKAMKSLLLISLSCLSLSALGADAPVASEQLVVNAVQDGLTGVALSNLALEKSESPVVQEFARDVLTLHQHTIAELAELARSQGIDVPADLDSTRAALVLAVDTEEGASFDHVYAQHMKADHARIVALFEEAARSDDADLAQFARKVLPSLKAQKAKARKLAKTSR